jgi:hypothetical protein
VNESAAEKDGAASNSVYAKNEVESRADEGHEHDDANPEDSGP